MEARETATSALEGAQDGGVALAAAAAQGDRTDAPTASTQFVQHRQREAIAAHPDRVAEGDGTTVDVDDVVADPQLGDRSDAHRGECLVDLEQVDVADCQAG